MARCCALSDDNRRFLHAMRAGCPWRAMHECYGKWNSIYARFRRWVEPGAKDALLASSGPVVMPLVIRRSRALWRFESLYHAC